MEFEFNALVFLERKEKIEYFIQNRENYPFSVSLTVVICGYLADGQLEKALKILEDILSKNLEENDFIVLFSFYSQLIFSKEKVLDIGILLKGNNLLKRDIFLRILFGNLVDFCKISFQENLMKIKEAKFVEKNELKKEIGRRMLISARKFESKMLFLI